MSADDGMPSAAQVEAAEGGRATHPREPHAGGIAGRLNWLRAAVLRPQQSSGAPRGNERTGAIRAAGRHQRV
jgi:hypothetical protein